jgi:hypothetical protein
MKESLSLVISHELIQEGVASILRLAKSLEGVRSPTEILALLDDITSCDFNIREQCAYIEGYNDAVCEAMSGR